MGVADRPKREVLDRLRLTEGQLSLSAQRVTQLEQQLAEKDRLLAEARRDTERLDFLEKHRLALNHLDLHDSEPPGTPIRDAIDSAIARSQEQGK